MLIAAEVANDTENRASEEIAAEVVRGRLRQSHTRDRRHQQLRPPGALSPAGDDQVLVAAVCIHDPDPTRRGP